MSEGYLFRAIGQDKYFEMNVCLAASLRYHGDTRPISVFTDRPDHPLFKKFPKLFSQIIDVLPLVEGLKKKFNRDFKTGFELGGLAPRLLCRETPYDKTISIDADMMAVSSPDKLWEVLDPSDREVAFLGCPRMYPGWGTMNSEELTNAEIQIEDDLRAEGRFVRCNFREVHGGIMWWKKGKVTDQVLYEFDEAIKSGKLYKYFPKVVDLWWGHLSDEVVYSYVMSILDLPVIPYNKNLMGSNPEFFSVEDGLGNMGHLLTNPRLLGHMKFEDTVPVLIHFFAKDQDPNYARNRDFLMDWLSKGGF